MDGNAGPREPPAQGGVATPISGVGLAGHRHHIFAGGAVRTYCLHIPPGYDPGTPVPLVINLHGIAANAQEHERLIRMTRQADQAVFIAAYPEALGQPAVWRIGSCHGCAEEMAFMRALIEHLCARLSIDAACIYASGFSNGAGMANRMACEMADVIAAIGLVSGAYPTWNHCLPARPVPVVAFHGTADPVVPYEGLGTALPPIRDWAARWACRNGCGVTPAATVRLGSVTAESWSDQHGDVRVTLYSLAGGEHGWPGADTSLKYGMSAGIDATAIIWEFFAARPMP